MFYYSSKNFGSTAVYHSNHSLKVQSESNYLNKLTDDAKCP